jgi:hypothetical protein
LNPENTGPGLVWFMGLKGQRSGDGRQRSEGRDAQP